MALVLLGTGRIRAGDRHHRRHPLGRPGVAGSAGGRGRPERGAAVVPMSGATRAHGPPPRLGRRAVEPFELAARAAVTNDSSELLDLLVEGGALSSDLRAQVLERAGGNPFFLEEIVQRLLDEPASVEDLEIPDTVQGVLAARIDLLTPIEKRVLQSASVVGRTFWNGAVGSLLEPGPDPMELDEGLSRLEDRGLVHGRAGSSIVGERQFSFRHILIKDVAYEGLPRRDRARAHAGVAEWF